MIAPLEVATPYTPQFFDDLAALSSRSARSVVPVVLELTSARSVVDFGCGTGEWLKVFADHGVTDYLGIDGDYVNRSQLHIPVDRFQPMDLNLLELPDRRFDLAICLEVGEHLPAAKAPRLVDVLTGASPLVLFSAAIPGQNGTDHRNEQWPWYWRELFERRGFVPIDSFGALVWSNPEVQWWYRQNLSLYVNGSALGDYPSLAALRGDAGDERTMLIHESILRRNVDLPVARIVDHLGLAVGRTICRRWSRVRTKVFGSR